MNKRKTDLKKLQELVRGRGKKFVRYEEGAELYSIGLHTFQQLAKDAGAVYRINRIVLVNTEIFDEFLEAFHEFDD